MRISLTVLSQLFLKQAYTLDILICQFVYVEFSDGARTHTQSANLP